MPAPSSFTYPGYTASSRFDDIWNREDDICAYCAGEVSGQAERCPRCQCRLFQQTYRYEKPSTNFHLFWVLLLGCGQLFLINVLTDLAIMAGWPVILLHSLLFILFFGLTIGVYFRQFWAYASSIFTLLVLLFLQGLGVLTLIEETLPSPTNPVEAMLTVPFLSTAATLLRALQLLVMLLALLWGIFLVAPAFERTRIRVIARVQSGLNGPGDYDLAARQYADQGMWANAILHWQRAAAYAPQQWRYQFRLGQAYARLGFFERSLDMLQGIPQQVDVNVQRQIDRVTEAVQQLALAPDQKKVEQT